MWCSKKIYSGRSLRLHKHTTRHQTVKQQQQQYSVYTSTQSLTDESNVKREEKEEKKRVHTLLFDVFFLLFNCGVFDILIRFGLRTGHTLTGCQYCRRLSQNENDTHLL